MSNIGIIIDIFLLVSAAFALWKGGAAERIAAIVVIADVVIEHVVELVAPGSENLARLCTDGLSAAGLLFVTIRYAAPWMGGVMLFFAAQFSLHSYYLVMEKPLDNLHALVNNINWSGVSWCLIIGAAMTWRARLRHASLAAP